MRTSRGAAPRRRVKRAPPHRSSGAALPFRSAHSGRSGSLGETERAGRLPRRPGPIIGRDNEIAEARQWLLRAYVRLLTFTGAAGVGKTRLALEVAGTLLDAFDHGVVFVDLSPVADSMLVLSTIAQALQIREAPGRPLLQRVTDALRDQRLLIVLDNFEHVISAAPQVAELLAACSGVKLLITSREVLRVSWEQELPVAPLGLPDLRHLPPPDALTQVPAVEFFLSRARAVSPTFALTVQNARTVAEICIHLDGLPLAIELAAVGIKVLSPEAMLARLRDRLQIATTGLRDLPPRQRTLRAALDWSHELLPEPERAFLRRAAVFAGGFTLEAAEAISAGDGVVDGQVFDHLTRLVDKSLISYASAGPRPGYRMLETVRRYAEERLQESGEAEAVRGRHLDWCLTLAERAEPELQGPDQRTWLDRLEQEHDNLRSALGWAQASSSADGAMRLAGALWGFWYVRGYWTEGRRWLEAALAMGPGARRALRAKVINAIAVLVWAQGDYEEAAGRCEEGVSLCRAIDDRAGLAFSLNLLGLVMRHRGDYSRATAMLEESLALRRALDDTWGIASSLSSLGIIASYQGHYDRARLLFGESLTLRRKLEDRGGIAECLYFLGIVAFHRGDHRQAAVHLKQCLDLFRELGDRAGTASTLTNLGMLAQYDGEADRATRLYCESLSLRYELGDRQGIAECLERLAEVDRAQGRSRRAAQLSGAVEALRESLGPSREPAASPGTGTAEVPIVGTAVDVAGSPGTAPSSKADRARAHLDAARARGRGMTLEQAVEYARAFEPPPQTAPGARTARPGPPGFPLTRRELEIAALIAGGLTNRQIAKALVIAEGTAANHVQHILNKLGFDSRAQIAAWAAKSGMDPSPQE